MSDTAHITLNRKDIDLGNWRFSPQSQWAFQHVNEFIPSAVISAQTKQETAPHYLDQFAERVVQTPTQPPRKLIDFLTHSHTDALVIMQDGKIISEWYAEHCSPTNPHIVFSISKSIIGIIAGILVQNGTLSLNDTVDQYIPESVGSTYEKASLQNLLDMSVSIDFDEAYLDQDGAFERYRRAMMWNPPRPDLPPTDLLSFLCTMPSGEHAHGAIHDYRSPNTDLMGIMLERAAGQRLPDLIRDLLWHPMGAYSDAHLTVDGKGTSRCSAGLSMTARDLARLGELVRTGGKDIIPAGWVDDIWSGGDQEMWLKGCQPELFPEGSYRHLWYNTGSDVISAIGIHGQWLWIDRKTNMTIVKLSSYPDPLDEDMDQEIICFMEAITA